MGNFRPVVLMFETKIKKDDGVWEDAVISTAGYEYISPTNNPEYIVICQERNDNRGLMIARKYLTAITYFD